MAGIVFLRTTDLVRIVQFYTDRLGMRRRLSQPQIDILFHDNLLVGFSHKDMTDTDARITIFYPTRGEVDYAYAELSDVATTEWSNSAIALRRSSIAANRSI